MRRNLLRTRFIFAKTSHPSLPLLFFCVSDEDRSLNPPFLPVAASAATGQSKVEVVAPLRHLNVKLRPGTM